MNPSFIKLMAKRLREIPAAEFQTGDPRQAHNLAVLRDAIVELCDQLAETQERLP